MTHFKERAGAAVLLQAAIVAAALIPAASFADTRSGGTGTINDFLLTKAVDEDTDIWDVLLVKEITLSTKSNLTVTACSDVDNPGGSTANTYHFVIARDDTSPGLNTSSERTIDDLYDDPNKDDADVVHVCSTVNFNNVAAGTHKIRWLGSKANASMADVTIEDSSITINAFDGSAL
jgi:hypothetical protein